MTRYANPYYQFGMDDLDKLIARIREPILSGRMTKTEMARRAGLPITTLIELHRPGWNPRAATLKALLKAVPRRPLDRAANQRSVAA